MRYTTDQQGLMNNYAIEPKLYLAEQPSQQQQIRYVIQGVLAVALLAGLVTVATVVS